MLTAIVIVIILLIAAGLVYAGLRLPAAGDPLQDRIKEYVARDRMASLEEIEMGQSFQDRVVLPFLRTLGQLALRFTPKANLTTIHQKLEMAGNPAGLDPTIFWALQIVGAVGFGGIVLLMFIIAPGQHHWFTTLLLTVLFLLIGYFFPRLWLESRVSRRQDHVRKAMPDALDLLTICVEAGLGFDAAMGKVNEEWENELGLAFGRVIQEIRLGKLRREALRDMADRIGLTEMTSFVAAVIQSEQLGVSMGRVLRIQSDQMRVRRRQVAEEQARQAPVKMMLPLVFLIFPSILIILLGPAGLTLMQSQLGTILRGG
ncbi:MAG: type II secretion system F family protein [Anaerolineales bacterium]|jgi:tight adherence protein C